MLAWLWPLHADAQPAPERPAPVAEAAPKSPLPDGDTLQAAPADGPADPQSAAAVPEAMEASAASAPSEGSGAAHEPAPDAPIGDPDPRADDAALAELLAETASPGGALLPQLESDKLRLYGFVDMGFRRHFGVDKSVFARSVYTNAGSFFLGNINLYIDATPHPDWRALIELRFTNAPHGLEKLGVDLPVSKMPYERENARVDDYVALTPAMVLGSTVIERAWIEWRHSDLLQLRVGYWPTPFGIWNVDHGSPTLIAINPPGAIIFQYVPPQQLGVQALGGTAVGPWQLQYQAYVSNWRTPGELDLTDDKGLGGRLVLSRGRANQLTLGASGGWGRYSDRERFITQVDVLDADPLVISSREVVAFEDWVLGADVSWDHGPLRTRFEWFSRRLEYERGRAQKSTLTPASTLASRWSHTGYLLGAYRLPWWGMEPYAVVEFGHNDWPISDISLVPSAGINVYFAPVALLKVQYYHLLHFDYVTRGRDEARNNLAGLLAKLVLSF